MKRITSRFKPGLLFSVISALFITLLLHGDENLKPPAETANTKDFDFAPGGVIRLNGSYGDLSIEGWEQPRVQMTVDKFMPFEYQEGHPERASQHMEAVGISSERRSPTELVISTKLPPRHGVLRRRRPSADDVRVEYQLHVPRNSHLVIHHGVGMVTVSDVTGDIEATCSRGDIMVWLDGSGIYSVDARSRLGKVYSDFAGASLNQWLVGQKFVSPHPSTQRLYLRVGFGGITLKPILPESEARPAKSGADKK
jgi:hypothetical protein